MRRIALTPLLILAVAPLISGDALPWEKLPFSMRPMAQEGSDNLAPAIVKAMERWDLKGDATFEEVEGRPTVRLGPKQDREAARASTTFDAKPATLYSVRYKFRFTPDAAFDYDNSYPGLHGSIGARSKKDGSSCSWWRIHDDRMTTAWREYRADFYTTSEGGSIRFEMAYNGVKGAAFLTDLDIREARVPAEEGRQIILPPAPPAKRDANSPDLCDYGEASRAPEPERPNELTLFHRDDPDRLFFYSRPNPDEVNRPIRVALCPGEVGVTTAAVYTPRALAKLKPVISVDEAFRGKIAWQVVQYHPRRVDYYGRGRTWWWAGDFLLTRPDGVDVKADRTCVFWIKVMADPDAAAGDFAGKVVMQSGDEKVGATPLRVTVRPFKLADVPDKVWGMYADSVRWKKMSDEQVLRELDDFKAHGISCLSAPVRGEPVFEGERVTGWRFDETDRRLMGLVKRAGLPGPYPVWFGWLDRMLARRLGLSDEVFSLAPEQRPAKLTETYKSCLVAAKKEFEKQGWGEPAFLGVDEPGYWKKGSPEQFLWEYKAATESGWKTYCTSSYLPSDPIGKMLTYHCYSGGVLANAERAAMILKETHAAGQHLWYYRTGAYSGEIGRVARNRYYSGFVFFRSKADGSVSWTFQRARGDAFDDFYAQKIGQACVTYPDPEHPGENLDTPHWEGLRQGWLDYRYAATLAAIAKTSHEAGKELDAVLDAMPWNGDVFLGDDVTNRACDEWRERIAALIERQGARRGNR